MAIYRNVEKHSEDLKFLPFKLELDGDLLWGDAAAVNVCEDALMRDALEAARRFVQVEAPNRGMFVVKQLLVVPHDGEKFIVVGSQRVSLLMPHGGDTLLIIASCLPRHFGEGKLVNSGTVSDSLIMSHGSHNSITIITNKFGPREERALEEVATARGRSVYLEVAFLEQFRAASDAVAAVYSRKEGRVIGTAFLVADQCVLTALHVVRGNLADLECWFHYNHMGAEPTIVQFQTNGKIAPDGKEDVILLRLQPGELLPAHIRFSDAVGQALRNVAVDKPRCFIVGHPDTHQFKRLSMQRENFVTEANQETCTYLTDTEPGYSGSPCFLWYQGRLVLFALHCEGVTVHSNRGNPIGYNRGIAVQAIRKALKL